jgi:hypothetical protein
MEDRPDRLEYQAGRGGRGLGQLRLPLGAHHCDRISLPLQGNRVKEYVTN